MNYGWLVTLHLLAAIAFAGTVFFEVIILEAAGGEVPRAVRLRMEQAIGNRAVRIMPWVLLTLYGAGISMAWHYRSALANPWSDPFGMMLSIKILLAISVFGHFITAMLWKKRGKLSGERSHRLHISIFIHVLLIVVLAKGMFYLRF
ncbi:Conserved hypothetical protein [gamma proteobacterium HdN1]|nr:Conserved hypothetical protein [gamma proteobacterium HdN1]